ncbi:hypothetical protein BB561_000647 [Smittium simulii]|uniref:PWI domain-containing protein n=1 Tax=Smittium simulii TaxID=133385 RepID=A0A2T9YYG8_9FUNG|nr:hypothetical protein BB561_000647 [Smittium simulii]
MSGGFFKGTSLEQDSRFGDPQKKLLNKIKFPESFKVQVDMKKVNLTVMKPWIAKKVFDTLGFDDEVVVEYVFSMLEEEPLDPRKMQINLTGFLEQNAPKFMETLWDTLIGAQSGLDGIPSEFIEAKKQELLKKQLESEQIMLKIREQKKKITMEKTNIRDKSLSPDSKSRSHRDLKYSSRNYHKDREVETYDSDRRRRPRHYSRDRSENSTHLKDKIRESGYSSSLRKKDNTSRDLSSSRNRNKYNDQSQRSRGHYRSKKTSESSERQPEYDVNMEESINSNSFKDKITQKSTSGCERSRSYEKHKDRDSDNDSDHNNSSLNKDIETKSNSD